MPTPMMLLVHVVIVASLLAWSPPVENHGSEDQGGAFTADIDYSLAASTGCLTRGLFSRRHVVLTKSFQLVEVYSVRENGRDAFVKVAHYPDKGLHTFTQQLQIIVSYRSEMAFYRHLAPAMRARPCMGAPHPANAQAWGRSWSS